MPEATAELTIETDAKTQKVKGDRVTGQALLDLAAANQESVSEEEFLRLAGYYIDTLDENGEIVHTTYKKRDFYLSLAAATGVTLAIPKKSAAGRKPRQWVKVNKGGKIAVVAHHSEAAGFNEGDKVKILAEQGKITIVPFTSNDEEEDESDLDLDL